jgi:hypothetical protein
MDKQLLKKLISASYKRSPQDDFADGMGGTVKVFVVETETSRCKIWNSSNNGPFDLVKACAEVADKILSEDDVCEGHFSVGFNEIWFEIEEK